MSATVTPIRRSTYVRALRRGVSHEEALRVAAQKTRGPARNRSGAVGRQHYEEHERMRADTHRLLLMWRRAPAG